MVELFSGLNLAERAGMSTTRTKTSLRIPEGSRARTNDRRPPRLVCAECATDDRPGSGMCNSSSLSLQWAPS